MSQSPERKERTRIPSLHIQRRRLREQQEELALGPSLTMTDDEFDMVLEDVGVTVENLFESRDRWKNKRAYLQTLSLLQDLKMRLASNLGVLKLLRGHKGVTEEEKIILMNKIERMATDLETVIIHSLTAARTATNVEFPE